MLDSEENIHIITPPPSRARGLIMPRQECVSRLMLGISSCPTLISIYADNAADPDYGGESNLPLPPTFICQRVMHSLLRNGVQQHARCFMEKGAQHVNPRQESGTSSASGRRAHLTRIGCCLLVARTIKIDARARLTKYLRNLRPTVHVCSPFRPPFLLAGWIRTIEEKEGKAGRPREGKGERCDEVVAPLPSPLPSTRSMPSPMLQCSYFYTG